MTTRPRLLFLSHCLPYPPHSGVTSRTFNVSRQLAVDYDVDLVAFSRRSHQPGQSDRDAACRALRGVAASVAEPTPIPSEHSTLRRVSDHLRSVLSGRVFTYYQYGSRAFADRLRATLRARTPDLVHLDSLDVHRWVPDLPPVPIICTHHDVDSDLLRLRAGRVNHAALRRYLLLQAARLERLERELCPRFRSEEHTSELQSRLHL